MSKNNQREIIRTMTDQRQRFALRKYGVGLASVLIGLTFLGGVNVANADAAPSQPVVATQPSTKTNKDQATTTTPAASQKVDQQATTPAKQNSDQQKTAVATNQADVPTPAAASTTSQVKEHQPASVTKQTKSTKQADTTTTAPVVNLVATPTTTPATSNSQFNVSEW